VGDHLPQQASDRSTVSSPSDLLVSDDARLKDRTIRAARFGFGSQLLLLLLNIASLAVLSRMLSPSDFGLVAMASSALSVLSIIADSGFSFTSVQRQDLTHQQVSNVFWANSLLAIAASVAACLLSPVLAWFYGRDELVAIGSALGICLIGQGASLQHMALMRRELHYGRLSSISIASTALALACAIVAASLGAGYWALVVQQAVAAFSRSALAWMCCPWRPAMPRRNSGSRSVLGVGATWSLAELLGHLRRAVDQLLLGWHDGPQPLGVYVRAGQVLLQPMYQALGPLTSIALPALSRVQSQPDRFRRGFLQGVDVASVILVPLCCAMAACSEPAVLAILGPGWADSIPVLEALSPAAIIFASLHSPAGWAFAALGKAGSQLVWSSVSVVVFAAACWIGVQSGPVGVAIASSVASMIVYPLAVQLALRESPVRPREVYGLLARPIIASALSGLMVRLSFRWATLEMPATLILFLGVVEFAVLYLAMFACDRRGRARLAGVLALAARRPRPDSSASA
jgi:O-antigen/teichoic acid export membrane protein